MAWWNEPSSSSAPDDPRLLRSVDPGQQPAPGAGDRLEHGRVAERLAGANADSTSKASSVRGRRHAGRFQGQAVLALSSQSRTASAGSASGCPSAASAQACSRSGSGRRSGRARRRNRARCRGHPATTRSSTSSRSKRGATSRPRSRAAARISFSSAAGRRRARQAGSARDARVGSASVEMSWRS